MAAKTTTTTRRQGWFSKVVNAGLILLGFSNVIVRLIEPGPIKGRIDNIVGDSTFGFGVPPHTFNLERGLRMYTPGGAAASLGFLKSYLFRKFPVRR